MRKRGWRSVTAAGWLAFCVGTGGAGTAMAQTVVPKADHVVLVIEENHAYSEIIGKAAAPYINSLAGQGALFSASFAVAHPSEPNYLALFSGSTQGVTDDGCQYSFTNTNLASELIEAGLTFGGYSEDMPSVGYMGCTYRAYARKHSPWVYWQGANVPAAVNMPLTSFPMDFSTLPTVSMVIPNLNNDMHDGTVKQGDTWLQKHLDGYVQWAASNNSLLIVTWDEDDQSASNRIATIFVGPMVKPGLYAEKIDHYSVLRTIEEMYGLPYAGKSADASAIADVWSP
jgi:phosphatidylinositol-3-phosphatase